MRSKNRITLVILHVFVLLMQTLNAQPTAFREKPRKVKMPKYFVTEQPKKSPSIAAIRIMQAVWDSTRLGFLQKGIINIKTEALPSEDLTNFLQEYADRQYKDWYKKSGKHLLIMIKELRINEKTFFSANHAFIRFSADAWVSADADHYWQAVSTDTVFVYKSMVDVTSLHGENIARGIYLLVLASLKKIETGSGGLMSEMKPDWILEEQRKRFHQPILTDTVFKEGAYMSFQEFLQNNPSVPLFEISAIDKINVKIEAILPDSARQDIVPWGVCKGGEIYKYYEQELIPIEKNNNGFIISDYLEKSHRRNGSIFLGSVFGGVIGAGIASVSATKMYEVTNIPYIKKKQPEACAIDMKSGELTF